MSAPDNISTQESMDKVMKAMTENVGPYSEAIRKIMLPTEQAKVDTNRVIIPQENQVQYDSMRQFLPQYTQLDLANDRSRALGTVERDSETLDRAAQTGLVDKALQLQVKADPEYYKNRAELSKGLSKLSQFDPDKLSGSEVAQTTRGLNQTSMGAPNLGGALAAAATFGNALAKRRGEHQSYMQTIAGSLPQLRTGFDPYQVATGKNSGPGQAAQGNQMYDRNSGQTAQGMGSNVFGAANSFQQQYNKQEFQKPTGMDTAMKGMSMAGSLFGGGV
jgi:hypothetical protein